MARKKVAAEPALKSWADVDAALKEILYCNGCIDEVEVTLNREIAEAKDRADVKTRPMRERVRGLEAQMREYVDRHRDDLDGKTKRLNFGQTGYRLSTKLIVPKPADVLARLHQYGMDDCITVKESVNKDALKRYKSEDILKTGAYLRTDDDFWYEVDTNVIESTD